MERAHKTREMHINVNEGENKNSEPGSNCIRDNSGKIVLNPNGVTNRLVEYYGNELYHHHDKKGDQPDVNNQSGCTIMK